MVISEINGKVGNFAGAKVVKFLALGVLFSCSLIPRKNKK
jgi:hypothetical protein